MIRFSLTPAALLAALAGTALGQSTEPFPAVFELSSLLPANGGDGSDGFVINGIDVVDLSGSSVSSAGDVNGDGLDDLIIGAIYACPNAILDAGESYVVFGSPQIGAGGVFELSTLIGSNGFQINGIDTFDRSGSVVSSAGDVNDDGFDDLIIGAEDADPNGLISAGESYVIFGGSLTGAGGVIESSALNGTNGFVINGTNQGDFSGTSVSSAGDVNGDGIDDLIIGAHYADPNGLSNAGQSYVIFGAAGVGVGGVIELSSLNGTNGFVLNGVNAFDRSARSVSSAGDVNGDGIDDLIIGADDTNPNGSGFGSYVIFGAFGLGSAGFIELSSLNGTNGFVLNGTGIGGNEHFGYPVASAGDVNGDGLNDLLIGAPFSDSDLSRRSGKSYVVFGAISIGAGGAMELSSLNGTNGFEIIGIDRDDYSGGSVSSAGDVNGDGFDDVLISTGLPYPNGPSAGESYVIFGAVGVGSGGVIELSSLNGLNGFVLSGNDGNDKSGFSVSCAGDVNADGIDDLVIGAPFFLNAGATYVVFGRNTVLTPCDSDADHDGEVNFNDITIVLSNWQNDYTPNTGPGDTNLDSVVNFNDITSVLSNWLVVCP